MSEAALKALSSTFSRLGVSAVIDPDGDAVAAKLLPSEADGQGQIGGLTLQDRTGVYEVLASVWGDRPVGTVIELTDSGNLRRKVTRKDVPDDRRLKVRLETKEVAGA